MVLYNVLKLWYDTMFGSEFLTIGDWSLKILILVGVCLLPYYSCDETTVTLFIYYGTIVPLYEILLNGFKLEYHKCNHNLEKKVHLAWSYFITHFLETWIVFMIVPILFL